MTEDLAAAIEPATTARPIRFGLSTRVLALIIFFMVLAEVAIYVPSIASFRNNWLMDRLAAARIAAMVLEVAPKDMVPEDLKLELLSSVGAKTIVLKMHDTRRLLAVSDMPPQIDETSDLRDPDMMGSIAAAFRALSAPSGRNLNVKGTAAMGADYVEITIDEMPLKAAMWAFSINIIALSLFIAAIVAALAALALHWMVLRPVRRLTSNLMEFGANPEDVSRIIRPSGAAHEIGRGGPAAGLHFDGLRGRRAVAYAAPCRRRKSAGTTICRYFGESGFSDCPGAQESAGRAFVRSADCARARHRIESLRETRLYLRERKA